MSAAPKFRNSARGVLLAWERRDEERAGVVSIAGKSYRLHDLVLRIERNVARICVGLADAEAEIRELWHRVSDRDHEIAALRRDVEQLRAHLARERTP